MEAHRLAGAEQTEVRQMESIRVTARRYEATMRFHYRAADALAKVGKLTDAAKALEAAELCRIKARELGANGDLRRAGLLSVQS